MKEIIMKNCFLKLFLSNFLLAISTATTNTTLTTRFPATQNNDSTTSTIKTTGNTMAPNATALMTTPNITNTTTVSTQNSTGSTDSTQSKSTVLPGSTTKTEATQSISASSPRPTTPGTTGSTTSQTTQMTANGSSTSNAPPQSPTTASPLVTSMTAPYNDTGLTGLNHSEKTMTIFFSVVLGVIVLGLSMYTFSRCKRKRIQYSHQPLYNSEDTVEQFAAPDDTLVISGGLYDGPQTYNPTMTMNEEEFHSDQTLFASQPTQFRLEFLNEEREKSQSYEASTFQTFQPIDEDL